MEFSLGLVEVSSLGNAIRMLDEMTKVADVEFVAVERKLGGRLVTIVVRGSVSAVNASVEAGKAIAENMNCLKAAEVIARPHPEIFKFLHLEENLEKQEKNEDVKKPLEVKTAEVQKPDEKKSPAKKATPKKAETPKKGADKKSPQTRSKKTK